MALSYKIVLALHIISVISWMAGILYLYRLLIYRVEENEKAFQQKLERMADRLYRIITIPAMLASALFGIVMLAMQPGLLTQPWMHAKLLFVVLLMTMTFFAGASKERISNGSVTYRSRTLRILNEVPTLLMILIVFFVILKPFS